MKKTVTAAIQAANTNTEAHEIGMTAGSKDENS